MHLRLFTGALVGSVLLYLVVVPQVNGEELAEVEEGGGDAIGCDKCGAQCRTKCGTRLFRPCCFHFVKKRNSSRQRLQYFQQQPGANVDLPGTPFKKQG
ncbi:unnamed protein product, partial [Allacma fusca]